MMLIAIAQRIVGVAGGLAIKLTVVALVLVMVIAPPLFIHEVFPQVREWWGEQEGGVERTAFLALIGVLGIIPYMFTAAMGRIPGALKAIYTELRTTISDSWVPDCCGPAGLAVMAKRRIVGATATIKASASLIGALVTLATVIMCAGMLITPAVGHVTIEFVWATESTRIHQDNRVWRFTNGERISIYCDNERRGQKPICTLASRPW